MRIIGLNKHFGSKSVFRGFNCEILEGSVNHLVGKSGSGKTTLLRILAGLDNDFIGKISPIFEKISYVFQEPRLLESLNVIENVKIVAKDSEIRAIELLEMLELSDSLKLYPSELSGGMKMRVNLARALNYDADLYLLDEPFSALDEDLKRRILPKVFKYLNSKTVIIISHNPSEVRRYSKNIIDLDKNNLKV